MRIISGIIVFSLLALVADCYIYRRHVRGRGWKIPYIVYALATDLALPGIMLFFRGSDAAQSDATMRLLMFAIGFVLLNAAPKIVYALVAQGDLLLPRRRGRRRKLFTKVGAALALVVAAVLLHSLTVGRSSIRVTRVELAFDNLPAAFDGLRVVQFSDVHLGTLPCRDRFLVRLADKVNGLRPDIVVSSGDLVNTYARELDPAAMEILSGLYAPLGVWSVLGNHDLAMYSRDDLSFREANLRELEDKQAQMGWRLLRGEVGYVRRGGDSIAIAGLGYPSDLPGGAPRGGDAARVLTGAPGTVFTLVLSHTPQLWDDIRATGRGDLTLSGHVHSMQTKLSLFGRRWSPAAGMYERWSGLYGEDGRYLYVNDGLGCVMLPMRIGVRPEVTLITLRSK